MKKKSKISVLDIFIGVFFAFSIIVAVYRINHNYIKSHTDINNGKEYLITVKATLPSEHAEGISIGDTVLDLNRSKFIGKVTNVSFSDFTAFHSGTQKEVSLKNKMIAEITFAFDVTNMKENQSAPAHFIVGEIYGLALPSVAFDGLCISLMEVPAESVD